jgi:hypothetical protein
MRQHTHLTVLIGIFLLVNEACTKETPAPARTMANPDPLPPSPVGTTQTVLEKTFNLKGSATFPFEIPARAVRPHLHGIFESFVGQLHGVSDNRANIDFLILNQEQQAGPSGSRASEALFSVEASHSQAVNFDLPPSMNKPVKYYLVFRNAGGGKGGKVVEASFRVDF